MLRYCRVRQVGIKGNICGGGCRGHSSIVRGRVGISVQQTILLSTQQKGFSSRPSFFQGLVVRTLKRYLLYLNLKRSELIRMIPCDFKGDHYKQDAKIEVWSVTLDFRTSIVEVDLNASRCFKHIISVKPITMVIILILDVVRWHHAL